MPPSRIVISINASWNIVNFRLGLIRALQSDGHEVIAVAPHDEYASKLVAAGVPHHTIKINSTGLSPLADAALVARYHGLLKRLDADIFLGFTAKPNVYGSLAAQMLGMKVINNVSGLGTAFIRGGWLSFLVSTLYRLAFARSSTVFFQNDEDLALFVMKKLVQRDKAYLLPGSGIDLAQFQPWREAPRPVGGPFRFIFVGRMIRDKGVLEYVEAARRLRPLWPGVRFQMLGNLDVDNRTAISRSEVDEWVREGLIEYLGATEDVRPFLASADCAVLPSYREGLPRTLLEAAAMGLPLIATNVPGCRHIARHRVNGLLCNVRDAGSLAEAMSTMMESAPSERASWGREARSIAEREFSEDVVIARYREALARAFR